MRQPLRRDFRALVPLLPLSVTLLCGSPQRGAAQGEGARLVVELGCATCHGGLPADTPIRSRAPGFGGGPPPVDASDVYAALGSSHRPDFGLDDGERLALALFLGGTPSDDVMSEVRERFPDLDAAWGEAIFRALGCGGCHNHATVDPVSVGPDLSTEGARVRRAWLDSYLADPTPIRSPGHATAPGARMPNFELSDEDRTAVVDYLMGLGRPNSSEPPPMSAFEVSRTERLLEDRLSCLGCHRLGGRGGALGPSLEGVGQRLQPGFIAALLSRPQTASPGAPMPALHLPDREVARVASLVARSDQGWEGLVPRSLADPTHPAWTVLDMSATNEGQPAGRALYMRYCAACHGAEGMGNGWNAANLPIPPTPHADSGAMGVRPDDTLFDGIHAGAFVLDGSPRMPAFGDLLSADQIRLLVAYIRVLCACEQPSWVGS